MNQAGRVFASLAAVAWGDRPEVSAEPRPGTPLLREHHSHQLVPAHPHEASSEDLHIQQEIETMTERLRNMNDTDFALHFGQELERAEMQLQARTNDVDFNREIGAVRADLCTQHGFESHELEQCEGFMRSSCPPMVPVPLVPTEYCVAFFRDEPVNFKAERASGFAAALRGASGAAPGPSPGPSPALFGGKVNRALPEQGVAGKPVVHEDQTTMTDDWMQEHGRWTGSRSFREICSERPDNEWCQLHGFSATIKPPAPMAARSGMVEQAEDGQDGAEKSSSWWPWPHYAQREDDSPADNEFPVTPPPPKPAWEAAEESGLPQFESKEPETDNGFPGAAGTKSSVERHRLCTLTATAVLLRVALLS